MLHNLRILHLHILRQTLHLFCAYMYIYASARVRCACRQCRHVLRTRLRVHAALSMLLLIFLFIWKGSLPGPLQSEVGSWFCSALWCVQIMLDKASTSALPTEVISRMGLSKVKNVVSAPAMGVLEEEEEEA